MPSLATFTSGYAYMGTYAWYGYGHEGHVSGTRYGTGYGHGAHMLGTGYAHGGHVSATGYDYGVRTIQVLLWGTYVGYR